MAEEKKEVVAVNDETGATVSTSVFGTVPGQNFLVDVLGQNFKQVKDTLIKRKVEDIERILMRKIDDNILNLQRKFESIKDDLVNIVPTSPMQTLNLNSLDPRTFCDGLSQWRLECHNDACSILADIDVLKSVFGKDWDPNQKNFVKSLILDFKNI